MMHCAVKSLIVLCLLTLPLPASAQSPTLDEKVRYILDVGDFNGGIDSSFNALRPMLIEQLRRVSNKITPDLADHIANIATEELNALKPSLMNFAIDFFKKRLDEEEVTALYDFYRTPTGSRIARKMNTTMASLMTEMHTFMATQFTPKLQVRLTTDPKLRSAFAP